MIVTILQTHNSNSRNYCILDTDRQTNMEHSDLAWEKIASVNKESLSFYKVIKSES